MRAVVESRVGRAAADALREWFRAQALAPVTGSSYVCGRLEAWYEVGSNLQSIATGRAEVFRAPPVWDRVRTFGDRHLPGWHSVLACGGPTSIDWHRDHGHFEAEALMVNLGVAEFWEQSDPRDPATRECVTLRDGDVVRLDVKVLHKSRQVSDERFHLTWRRVKPQFLPPDLAVRQ